MNAGGDEVGNGGCQMVSPMLRKVQGELGTFLWAIHIGQSYRTVRDSWKMKSVLTKPVCPALVPGKAVHAQLKEVMDSRHLVLLHTVDYVVLV
jgi:hypothetical protein